MKEYFIFYNRQLKLKIVESIERDETEEEKIKRIQKEEEEHEEKARIENLAYKGKKKTTTLKKIKPSLQENLIKDEIFETIKVYEAKPNNISMKNSYSLYFKWIASQLQVIKDLKVVDCFVRIIHLLS